MVAGYSRRAGRRLLGESPIRLNRKPDFLIIGAQKAGTSSLYEWLTCHPDVLPARTKELHYFDTQVASAPIRNYWPNFPLEARVKFLRRLSGRKVITGEATPSYLFDPRVPQMVADHLPTTKLIVLLRDPVERALSQYWMEVRRGTETLTLEEALSAELDRLRPDLLRVKHGEPPGELFRRASYVARGHYADQLLRWFAHFPRSQFLIVNFEDIATSPGAVYRRTLEFLDIDSGVAGAPDFTPVRVGVKDIPQRETVDSLRRHFTEPNERLYGLVGINFNPQR